MSKKNKWLKIRISEAEKAELDALAHSFNMPTSKFIRAAVARVKPWSPSDVAHKKAVLFQLAKIGANINQIARALNSNKDANAMIELAQISEQIEDLKCIANS